MSVGRRSRIAAVAPHPGAVAEHRRRRRAGEILLGDEQPPGGGGAPSIGSRFDDTRIVPIRSGPPSPVRL